jgi:hypothetical protein
VEVAFYFSKTLDIPKYYANLYNNYSLFRFAFLRAVLPTIEPSFSYEKTVLL